ncbi:hypothetical protein Tco_1417026, partial [Tanacetum coccineum]
MFFRRMTSSKRWNRDLVTLKPRLRIKRPEEIAAQCALEEREVVEHLTVDADYESEIEL